MKKPRVPRPGQVPTPSSPRVQSTQQEQRLKDLVRDIEHGCQTGRLELVAELRSKLVEMAPMSIEGAEAAFKLGLHQLFVERSAGSAEEAFRQAIRSGHSLWGRPARVSLGQLLFRTDRYEQASFELEKVIEDGPYDLVAVQARALLVMTYRAMKKTVEVNQLREEQKTALSKLVSQGELEGAIAQVWLGFEYKFDGQRREAKACFEAALEDKRLPEDERASAERALASL